MTPQVPIKDTVLLTEYLEIGYRTKKQKQTIAKQININLKKGKLIGLVGINGVGKSTLLKTLSKAQESLSGSIYLNGKNLNNFTPPDLAKTMSIVLTQPIQSNSLKVYELVAIGRSPYTNWVGHLSDNDKNTIEQAIRLTKIEHLANNYYYELSDGQQQIVMIARALAQDTDLIILDEPTTHLDLHHKIQILKLLQRLTKATGKTILFSSHDIELAIQLCDTMLVMQNQGITAGKPCRLINQGIFNTLFPKGLVNFDNETGRFRVVK